MSDRVKVHELSVYSGHRYHDLSCPDPLKVDFPRSRDYVRFYLNGKVVVTHFIPAFFNFRTDKHFLSVIFNTSIELWDWFFI